MTTSNITVGELIYQIQVNFTGVTEFGANMADILSGQAAPPHEGARFDVAFEGSLTGPKLEGTVNGVDYINIRADGRVDLHIHAEITTNDRQKISLFADGVATPEEGSPVLQLRENATLTTSSPAYAWVNSLQIWGIGTVDTAQGQVNVKVYIA
ncbi:MAG: DUF3237 family protein [Chloroflexi bacterium]|nr:DUF3237 family protein [Chloroflexota bacterium]